MLNMPRCVSDLAESDQMSYDVPGFISSSAALAAKVPRESGQLLGEKVRVILTIQHTPCRWRAVAMNGLHSGNTVLTSARTVKRSSEEAASCCTEASKVAEPSILGFSAWKVAQDNSCAMFCSWSCYKPSAVSGHGHAPDGPFVSYSFRSLSLSLPLCLPSSSATQTTRCQRALAN